MVMIPIKTDSDIAIMRQAGHSLAAIMRELSKTVQPGITTLELDRISARLMVERQVRPAFKGYRGFPGNICVSINEEVVHGIPGERKLRAGDIVGLDIGVEYQGFYADMAQTFAVGVVEPQRQRLIDAASGALTEALARLAPNVRLSEASAAVQDYVEQRGFSVVRDFVGHGIGRQLHEEPQIPNFRTKDTGPMLKEGMVFCIEPMINMGGWEVEVLADGWTAVAKDRLPSAHFEHTVAILRGGAQILTKERNSVQIEYA